MKVKSLIKTLYISPIGGIEITSTNNKILKLNFTPLKSEDFNNSDREHNKVISIQLDEYFAGSRAEFDLNLELQGTEFQKKVWQAILEIPLGQTATYSEIANKIGNPKAVRAVGMACNKNPLIIIVPCHRVVGAKGALTGYAGGLLKKQWLLTHENAI